MIRRLALSLVRRYPAAWRERYEAEVSALIDESPVRLGDLGELLRGLITERARELIAADDKPRRTAWVLTLMPALFILLFTVAAIGMGSVLRTITGPWSGAQQEGLGIAIVSLFCVLVSIKIVLDIRHARRPHPKPFFTPAPAWVACLLLPLVFLAVVCAAWADVIFTTPSYTPWWIQAFMWGYWYLLVVSHLASGLWPGRDLLQALAALEAAEGHLRMNEAWVESCREWIDKGVPSPLTDARGQVGYWTSERDAARARLQKLGYGARFRAPSAEV